MKKLKKYMLKHKILSTVIIALLTVLIVILLIIRFSPPILINLPIGQNYMQISIHQGFNIFYPKDNSNFYYFHNSLRPQIITDVNTSYDRVKQLPTFQIFTNFPIIQFSTPNLSLNIPTSTINKPELPNIPQLNKNTVTTKKIKLTFTIPDDYRLEYKSDNNTETINIHYGSQGNPEWMSIQLSDWQKCEDKPVETHNPYAYAVHKTITIAGKWPLTMTKSHPRYGSRDHVGDACLDNNITLDMRRYVEYDGSEVEKTFDKILESAQYRP